MRTHRDQQGLASPRTGDLLALPGVCLASVGEGMVPAHRELAPTLLCPAGASCRWLARAGRWTHVFLSKVNEVLEVNVVPIGLDVIVDKKVELVSNPVLENEGQDPCRQLQEEDEAEEHGELGIWTVEVSHRSWGATGQSSIPPPPFLDPRPPPRIPTFYHVSVVL